MKLVTVIALLTTVCPLFAAENASPTDPLAGAFFSPEVIMMARDQIGLTQEQQEGLHARMEKAQPRSNELKQRLERETTALADLVKREHVDEAALGAQLDKVLDVERELKHLHVGLMAGIKNQLTAEQQTKLREIARHGGTQLGEDARKRLSEKVERVKAGAQKWAASGRDPSEIARSMEEKFRPLVESGKIIEAEAELDRLLEQLKQDAK